MTVLVIGGTGFLSGALVARLVEEGHAVTILTRGMRPPPGGSIQEIRGDRRDKRLLAAAAARNFDAVIDMIAYRPEESAAAAEAFRGRTGRFIHCSTVSVSMVAASVRCPVTEDQDDLPADLEFHRNPFGLEYGLDKRKCERVLLEAHHDRLFPVSMIRPTFVSGPGDPAKRDWYWIERILDGAPLLVPGSGDHAFQQVYCGDAVRTIIAILNHAAAVGRTYNCAGEDVYSLNEYLGRLGVLLGRTPVCAHIPQEAYDALPFSTSEEGDVAPFNTRRTALFSLERIQCELGIRSTPFEEWMRETIAWWTAPGRCHSVGYAARPEEVARARKILSGSGEGEVP